jgi:hypothetical protein
MDACQTLVFSLNAAATASRSVMSTKDVLMLHFWGKNERMKAKVPPGGEAQTQACNQSESKAITGGAITTTSLDNDAAQACLIC